MSVKSILLAIMIVFLFVPSTLAYDVKTLQKVKKEQGAKKVTPVVSEDGSYYYFIVENKHGEIGVADYNGTLIVPIEYLSVCYLPPVEEGVSHIACQDRRKNIIVPNKYVKVYHKKTDASFFAAAHNRGDFYNLTGTNVASTKNHSMSSFSGFVILKSRDYTGSRPMYGEANINNTNISPKLEITAPTNYPLSFYRSDGTLIAEDIIGLKFIADDMVEYILIL